MLISTERNLEMGITNENTPDNHVKYSQDGNVCCPYCGNDYLHHKDVVIYNRTEDSAEGLAVHVTPEVVTTGNNLSGNPSARRSGLVIHFECENCSNTYELALAQHKGTTHLHWIR